MEKNMGESLWERVDGDGRERSRDRRIKNIRKVCDVQYNGVDQYIQIIVVK